MQSRNKEGLKRGEIRTPLILFQTTNLRFTLTNGNGKFELREALSTPQVSKQITKGLKRFEGEGWVRHASSIFF